MPRGKLGASSRECKCTWGYCEVRTRENGGRKTGHICTWIVRPGEELHRHTCAKCTAKSAMMKPPRR